VKPYLKSRSTTINVKNISLACRSAYYNLYLHLDTLLWEWIFPTEVNKFIILLSYICLYYRVFKRKLTIFDVFPIFSSCKLAPRRTRICTCQRVDGCGYCSPLNTHIHEGFAVQARNAHIGTRWGLKRDWAADVPCYCIHRRLEYGSGSDRGPWWLPLCLAVFDDNISAFQLFHDTAVYRHPSGVRQVLRHSDTQIVEVRGDDILEHLEVPITLSSSSSSSMTAEATEMRSALSPKAKRRPGEFL